VNRDQDTIAGLHRSIDEGRSSFLSEMADELRKATSNFRERTCACGAVVVSWQSEPECETCARARVARASALQSQREFLETVPEKFRSATLGPRLADRVTPSRLILATKSACLETAWCAFLGPAGAGKTSLAVAVIRERIRCSGEPWKMFQARQLGPARIQFRAGAGEAPVVSEAMRARFALIDDIGHGATTANDPIADIIFARDADCLPTWVTTGLTEEDVGNRYGGGVARRIFQQSKVVRLGGSL
jgi:hypothetical protein